MSTSMHIDQVLMGKYLAGEASAGEAMIIEDWLAESEENRRVFNEYQQAWRIGEKSAAHELPDKTTAWNLLQERIAARVPVKRFFSGYMVAASVAALLIVTAAGWYFIDKRINAASYRQLSARNNETFIKDHLPDGSSVVMSSGGRLSFPVAFTSEEREVKLEGEAFFEVTHDAVHPFLVHIDDITIRVLGTSFNIRKDSGRIETQVRSGTVRMFNKDSGVIIRAGQTGVYVRNENRFLLKDVVDVNSIGYATRIFSFNETSLQDMIRYLEKAYPVKIVLENKKLAQCKMSSSFDNKPIEYVMEVIAATLNIRYEIRNGIIYINGEANC